MDMGDTRSTLHGMRALAHPLRMRILSLVTDRAMSAAEVARELGDSQPNISYHLRKLADADLVGIVEEVPIRGGIAKRYRHIPPAVAAPRDPGDDHLLASALAAGLGARTARRAPGTETATDAELWVDPQVWRDTVAHVREMSLRLQHAAQPPRTPGTVRVSTTISMFEMDRC
ncbi:Helix-turn-helix domain-containing protein [Actinokineospora diospyrosa]|uniref:Helix-turn-helix domain-containing protein n=2 Tax=Actinokineospora diospyrosa TaxID=103728 RepID=A0ABT1I6M2_9PSEU|nr:Helix-turn-helix domain-containing protein [Actinokineospora diospyrosa]